MSIGKGDPVPALTGTTADGSSLRLRDFRGQWLVLYFYPRDNTPGCTLEAREFRDLHARFEAAGAAVVGVSRDSPRSHLGFTEKHALPFPLVADVDEAWCRAFDVLREKKLYGRIVHGIERSTFLVDPAGRIAECWRGVRAAGHAEAVLRHLPTAD